MKPFDLEAAKNGAPVQTRDGCKARIVCFDRRSEEYPIVALIDCNEPISEDVKCYSVNGAFYNDGRATLSDLVMAPVERTGWINVYPSGEAFGVFPTKEAAVNSQTKGLTVAKQITWDE